MLIYVDLLSSYFSLIRSDVLNIQELLFMQIHSCTFEGKFLKIFFASDSIVRSSHKVPETKEAFISLIVISVHKNLEQS